MLKHIGFIMDGNGRWAERRNLPRTEGYAAGLQALKKVAFRAQELGIEAISVYAFSKENWGRNVEEIAKIFDVVKDFNLNYDGDFKIRYMGNISELDDELYNSIELVEERTAGNKGLILNIALNYSGQDDIIHAAKICNDHGEFIDDTFESHLGSAGLPKLDLIVRSGGEHRLSGFMLYESAYAELIFIDKLWPDMVSEDVDAIVTEFNHRTRKFGKNI